ncbi:hypothetical protein Bca4012_043236 [Brassica carinata]|uniref:Uncharacterized protein n=1 Tax=Brassica carinata TaxID=52824 RepID=A0A8X7UF86_BRACI|nr:hypothetical protein Bca52824_059097 [Brassica carinata]
MDLNFIEESDIVRLRQCLLSFMYYYHGYGFTAIVGINGFLNSFINGQNGQMDITIGHELLL